MTGQLAGLVLLNKPGGITSFNALNAVKNNPGCKKVGHAGTLDKFAEGLLIALVGNFTKLVPYFVDLHKMYEAEITLGKETDTLDPEGSLVGEAPVPTLSEIQQVLPSFLGTIEQVPPKFSALHVQGRRAYQLAREGQTFQMRPRAVTILNLQVISFRPPLLTIRVHCSKGTYIRSLARDIALQAGSRGYVSSLKRTQIGPFSVEHAVTPDLFDPRHHIIRDKAVFHHLDCIQPVTVDFSSAGKLAKGMRISDDYFDEPPGDDGLYALFTPDDRFIALIEGSKGNYAYKFVRAGNG